MFKLKMRKISKKRMLILCSLVLIIAISSISLYGIFAARVNGSSFTTSSISGDTVYVNDLDADWNYYKGLNYTEVNKKTEVPSVNTGVYGQNSLAAVKITYDGHDVNDSSLVGKVSATEQQYKFVYYKYYPIKNNKIKIELIDNPFTARPTHYGFNGWVCDEEATDGIPCSDMTFSYDDNYYLRYVEIDKPAEKDADGNYKVVINLKASWTYADVREDIESAKGGTGFNDKGMQNIKGEAIIEHVPVYAKIYSLKNDVSYFVVRTVGRNENYTGILTRNNYGYYSDNKCSARGGCEYWALVDNNSAYDVNETYYVGTNTFMNYYQGIREATDEDFNITDDTSNIVGYEDKITGYKEFEAQDGASMSGYYYKTTFNYGDDASLYYNDKGVSCSISTCYPGNTVYKLIQPNESKNVSYSLKADEKYADGVDASSCTTTINKWKKCSILTPKLDEYGNKVYEPDASGTQQLVYEQKDINVNNPNDYYYFVTRDLNIINLSSGGDRLSDFSLSVPYTLTSNYDGSAKDNVIISSSTLTIDDDMVLEHIILDGLSVSVLDQRPTSNSINANWHNLKIGRDVKPRNENRMVASGVIVGSGSGTGKKNKVIVESGRYTYLKTMSTSNGNDERLISQYGTDYDRVGGVDDNLRVEFQALASDAGNHNSNSAIPTSQMIIKSGTFGNRMINGDKSKSGSYYTYGIYVGGISGGNSTSFRTLKIEGGRIYSINGGPCIDSDLNVGNVVGIYMTGGTVDNIVGGAGRSETYGNRIISITGGTVNYNVFGGSNSFEGSSSDGRLYGDTLIYVGGTANIGGGTDTLYNALPGNIFGAGAGRSGTRYVNLGNVNSAHIIVNGGIIEGNVYGGGNYGSTGKMSATGTYTKIDLLSGQIEGNIFGSSRENGSGQIGVYSKTPSNSVVYYRAYDKVSEGQVIPLTQKATHKTTGEVQYFDTYTYDDKKTLANTVCSSDTPGWKASERACYYQYRRLDVGSDISKWQSSSYVYDEWLNDNINVSENDYNIRWYVQEAPGTIGYINFGWHLAHEFKETYGNDAHDITINVKGGNVGKSVYGGSDNGGTVFANVVINLLSGNVVDSVFGGGYGSNTYVSGNIDINIKDGFTSANVYGGSALGTVNGTNLDYEDSVVRHVKVVADGGEVTNVFGGAMGSDTIAPVLNGPIFVIINDGKFENVYGGNNKNGAAKAGSEVTLNGGTITNAFGGSNETGFSKTKVIVNGSTVDNIYGGSNVSGVVDESNVYVNDGTINSIYGGNNLGGSVTKTNVILSGATVANAYGCGYGTGTSCGKTNVSIDGISGSTNVFGGGKSAGVTTLSSVVLNKGTVASIYGGSDSGGDVALTNVYITDGVVSNVYGGNNLGGETTKSIVNVGGGQSTNVYGGGRQVKTPDTFVSVYNGKITNLYGSGESGGSTTTNVDIYGGTIENTFGASNNGDIVNTSNVNIGKDKTASSAPGQDGSEGSGDSGSSGDEGGSGESGGSSGGTTGSTITIDKYGHEIDWSKIKIRAEVTTGASTQAYNFDAYKYVKGINAKQTEELVNEAQGYVGVQTVRFYITNPYDFAIEDWDLMFYSPNSFVNYQVENKDMINNDYRYQVKTDVDPTNSDIYHLTPKFIGYYSTTPTISIPAHATDWNPIDGSSSGFMVILSLDKPINFKLNYAWKQTWTEDLVTPPEGGDSSTITYPKVTLKSLDYEVGEMNVSDVYGGNNQNGKTIVSNVNLLKGTVKNIYGGNNAGGETNNANVTMINGIVKENLYGGGNNAVTGNTKVLINDGTIEGSAFGGGNSAGGVVSDNTDISIKGGTILQNAFGGGNAANVTKVSKITIADGEVKGSLFGSGNSAQTGIQEPDKASSIVNFLGGTVLKNVYGGANTSVVYGYTFVNIGEKEVDGISLADYKYDKKIKIGGTIFGGGESKSENNDKYDFSFKSVTEGIEVSIDATDYEFVFSGSIFGSGNASSSKGTSDIYITNLGTEDKIHTFTSIQRTDNAYLNNCHVQILGTTDRTLPRPDYIYSLSKIENSLYMLGSTELYLKNGANETHGVYSGYYDDSDNIQKEYVKIDENGVITDKKGDNKIYMAMDKKLNVLTASDLLPENAGNVMGMAFLGMYVPVEGDAISFEKGIYDTKYVTGDTLENSEIELLKYSGTYVYGKHYTNHDITVDGYYSNFVEDGSSELKIDYVGVTPENARNYYWAIGVQLTDYEVKLYASELTTEGVKNVALDRQPANADMKLFVNSVQYNELNSSIHLVSKENIKMVADSSEIANTNFGLSFGTSDSGWKNTGMTNLYTSDPLYDGTLSYEKDSNGNPPTLSFYLYYSKNVKLEEDEDERSLGYVSVKMTAETPNPEDDLDVVINYIEVKIKLYIRKESDQGYSSAITPGKKYDVFPQMKTNISSNGALSIYHNLFVDLNGKDANDEDWSKEKIYSEGSYRALVSDYVYPVGTTITMLDLTEKEYYYYTVTEEKYNEKLEEFRLQNEVSYKLSDFVKMASTSTNNNYDDAIHNEKYYHSGTSEGDRGCAAEEFIFMLDFANANVLNDVHSKFYMELRNKNDRVILAPKSSQAANMEYNIYTNKDSTLVTTGSLSTDVLYVGDSALIDLQTKYIQASVDDVDIYDSTYDEYKLGSTITIYDKNGNMLDGSSLLGVTFTLDGRDYYPQTHGIVRIPLAGKVSDVNSKLTINTANSNLTNGEYTIRIETFGSYDGIYNGGKSSEPLILNVLIRNNKFGLDVKSEDVMITHDYLTGADENGNNKIDFDIVSSSGLAKPDFRVSLQRRSYTSTTDAYEMTYEAVDLADYVTETLEVANEERHEYYISKDGVPEELKYSLTLKNTGLKTGTYRIVFSVYDDNNYIGSVYRYLIIRDM